MSHHLEELITLLREFDVNAKRRHNEMLQMLKELLERVEEAVRDGNRRDR
jgi:hypothetical protein